MEQLVFERLAKQFSELCVNNKDIDVINLQNTMRAAGRAFFHTVSKEEICFSDIRPLLKKEPKKTNPISNKN